MRKVFLSSIILSKVPEGAEKYYSEEIEMSKEPKKFFMSHIIDANVQEGDEVVIITNIPGKLKGNKDNVALVEARNKLAEENYQAFREEATDILMAHKIKVEETTFVAGVGDYEFSNLACHRFFKFVAQNLKEDDILYVDITFGMKPYTFSMFIAAAYAVNAAENIKVGLVAYAERYNGTDPDMNNTSIGYDLTSLFYLNEIAANVGKGNKASTDKVLDVLIS